MFQGLTYKIIPFPLNRGRFHKPGTLTVAVFEEPRGIALSGEVLLALLLCIYRKTMSITVTTR